MSVVAIRARSIPCFDRPNPAAFVHLAGFVAGEPANLDRRGGSPYRRATTAAAVEQRWLFGSCRACSGGAVGAFAFLTGLNLRFSAFVDMAFFWSGSRRRELPSLTAWVFVG